MVSIIRSNGQAGVVLVLDCKRDAMQRATDLATTALLVHGCSNLKDIRIDLENGTVRSSVSCQILHIIVTYLR
jgi:hypothetical protein